MKNYIIIGFILILMGVSLSGCIFGNKLVGSWENGYSTFTFSENKFYHRSYGKDYEENYTFDGTYLEYDTFSIQLGEYHCKVEVEFINSNTMRLEGLDPTAINFELYNGIWNRN